jgi:hypothetical protein
MERPAELGTGDDIKMDASYSKGATKYVISTSAASPSFAMFGGSSFAYQSVGFGATTDGVWLPVAAGGDGDIHLTTAFGVRGAFNHNWDAYWSTSLFGSYAGVRYDGSTNDNLTGAGLSTAKGACCAAFAASHPGQALVGNSTGAYTCNPDYNVSQLGLFDPLDSGQESDVLGRSRLVSSESEDVGQLGVHAHRSATEALYEFKNQNTVVGQVRVQRNF